jgi:hypothetical protein
LRPVASAETDAKGEFRMEIDPVADARLVVASELEAGGVGVGAVLDGLDLTRDRDDLVLRVPPSVFVTVSAAYPDGKPVATEDMRVLVDDPSTGWWHSSRANVAGFDVPVARGRRARVVVFARRSVVRGEEELFRGTAELDGDPAVSKIVVALVRSAAPPPSPKTSRSLGWDAQSFAQRTLRLRVVDASDGRPVVGRTIQLLHPETSGGASTTLVDDGGLSFVVGLGRHPVRVVVDGYEPLEVVVEAVERGNEDVELRLHRSPD